MIFNYKISDIIGIIASVCIFGIFGLVALACIASAFVPPPLEPVYDIKCSGGVEFKKVHRYHSKGRIFIMPIGKYHISEVIADMPADQCNTFRVEV